MAINSSSIFDTVVISCRCYAGEFENHWVQQGTSVPPRPSGYEWIPGSGVFDTSNAEVQEVIRRVKAGTAEVYYFDDNETPYRFHRVDDAPLPFWQFHDRHPFWPDDGYKIGQSLVQKGDLTEESDGNRRIEYEGGFVPTRPPAVGATIEHGLGNWSVFRVNDDRIGFRVVIPSSLNIRSTDLPTYADAEAFIDWLDGYRTEGDPIPANWSTVLAGFSGRKWRIPTDPDDPTRRGATFDFSSLTLSTVPGTQQVIVLTVMLDIDEYDSGFTSSNIRTDDIAEVVNGATGSIAATNQTVEPPFGAPDVTTNARRLHSNDGDLYMAGGLALAQWKDPGSETQRTMPLTGFGRSIDYAVLPPRSGGGKWVPRPEEKPRVDLIHFNETSNSIIAFEDAGRVVGYAGTDRLVAVHNRSEAHTLTVIFEKVFGTPQNILTLRPGERITVRIVFELSGDSEYVVEQAPPRYLVRGGSSFSANVDPYDWSTGGVDFGFRPWFGNTSAQRRDEDEFTFGNAAAHSSGDDITAGLANSLHVTNITHHGDLIFYEQVEVEIRGSGVLGGGHSAVLVRQRGNDVSILSRVWQPSLTGVGSHRTYTTAFIDECQPGDRYVSGLLYIKSGTTIGFNNLRVNTISQIMRVAPRIIV